VITECDIVKKIADVPDLASLTAGLARGDEAAFREFYKLYFHRLLRYLLVLARGREELAREALQTTLVRVARYAKKFETEEVFWSWLTVLARSAIIDEQRKSNRYLCFLTRWFAHREVYPTVPEEQTSTCLSESLETALSFLPEDDRLLIQMKYLEGQSVRDIAGELFTTEKAIESRLSRLRRKLKILILEKLSDEK